MHTCIQVAALEVEISEAHTEEVERLRQLLSQYKDQLQVHSQQQRVRGRKAVIRCAKERTTGKVLPSSLFVWACTYLRLSRKASELVCT